MADRGRTFKRCSCTDPATGKPLGPRCPDLPKRHHAETGRTYDIPITTSKGRKPLVRSGLTRESDAATARDRIRELVALAGADKPALAAIGDLIWERTKRGGELPSADYIRRRFALGRDLDSPAWRGVHGWQGSAGPDRAGCAT